MKWFSGVTTLAAFAILYLLENKRPLRKMVESRTTNTVRNLSIAIGAGLAANSLEKPIADKLTKIVQEKNIGLLKIFKLPRFIETVLAVILLDYSLYLWHYLTHKNPFLWRFHKVHHADLDLTVSTAIRFHFGEITISVLFRAGQILLIGISPQALKFWQTLLFASIFFHHSNLRISQKTENLLQNFIVTPQLHSIHHSIEKDEMDSNWSSGLIFWDKIHSTFRNDFSQTRIKIGVKEFGDENKVSLIKMIEEPFR